MLSERRLHATPRLRRVLGYWVDLAATECVCRVYLFETTDYGGKLMFTSEQLDALQAAAEAATPGPWKHSCYGEERGNGSQSGCNVRCSDDEVAGEIWHFDASYLVAWNPAVALEFVAAHREVVKQRDDVAKRLSEYLDDSTGGQLSKPWYPVSVMVEDTKAHYSEIAESDHADSCENKDALDAALSRIARVEALHVKGSSERVEQTPDGPLVAGFDYYCTTCADDQEERAAWPCDTKRALTEGEPSE